MSLKLDLKEEDRLDSYIYKKERSSTTTFEILLDEGACFAGQDVGSQGVGGGG